VLIVLALIALFLLPEPWGLVAVLGALVLEFGELLFWRRFLRRYRLRTGPELLIGMDATVVEACAPLGRVRVRGELWRARSSRPVGAGEAVRIAAIDGLTLEVEPRA
jgi:membrane-bound serine protease (ClpP class)